MTTDEQLLERYMEALAAIKPALEAFHEAICQAFQEVWMQLRPALNALLERWRREALYERLRDWHFPHWLAEFISQRWPERWLLDFS